MTAWFFVIHHGDPDKIAGGSLLAIEARYVANCLFGAPRLDRHFATPKLWNEIRHTLSVGLSNTPLPRDGAISVVVLGELPDVRLQYLTSVEVDIDAPEQTVPLLDNVLISQTGALQAPSQRVG